MDGPVLHAHKLFISDESMELAEMRDIWYEKVGMIYIAAGILYIPVIFAAKRLWRNQQPIDMKPVRIIHNIIFTLFSLIAAIELTPVFIGTWIDADYNFTRTVCSGYWQPKIESFWVVLFVASKLFEMIESFYFILEKKPIPFIHWYHHWMTFVFSTQALYFLSPGAIYYTWMNLWVHAIMYFYYTLTCLGYRPFWAILVTASQIAQMFVGVAVSYIALSCEAFYPGALFGFLMYLSYVYLFGKFFVSKYLMPRSERVKKD